MEYKEGRVIYTQKVGEIDIVIRQSHGTCILTIPGYDSFGYDLHNQSVENRRGFYKELTQFVKEHDVITPGDSYTNRIHLLKDYVHGRSSQENYTKSCSYFIELSRDKLLKDILK